MFKEASINLNKGSVKNLGFCLCWLYWNLSWHTLKNKMEIYLSNKCFFSTKHFHLKQFDAVIFALSNVRLLNPRSCSIIPLHMFLGLLRFHKSCEIALKFPFFLYYQKAFWSHWPSKFIFYVLLWRPRC